MGFPECPARHSFKLEPDVVYKGVDPERGENAELSAEEIFKACGLRSAAGNHHLAQGARGSVLHQWCFLSSGQKDIRHQLCEFIIF